MLSLEDISLAYGTGSRNAQRVVSDLSLSCPVGAILGILGPSGAGKSSLLNAVAGLHAPEAGSIAFDGEVWFDSSTGANIEPSERRIGLMVQAYALWPHMSVQQHLAFPLEHGFGKVEPVRRNSLIDQMLSLLGLKGLEGRRPSELSGGQQQRLALGRAMINRPRLILLDEPFSNLDPNKRRRIARDIRRVQKHFDLTVLIATHDHEEVALIADSLAVMMEGRLAQHDSPHVIYNEPATRAVGEFMGDLNVMEVSGIADGRVCAEGFEFPVAAVRNVDTCPQASLLAFRPSAVRIVDPTGSSFVRGRVAELSRAGEMVHATVATNGGGSVIVKSLDLPSQRVGDECAIDFPANSAFLLPV